MYPIQTPLNTRSVMECDVTISFYLEAWFNIVNNTDIYRTSKQIILNLIPHVPQLNENTRRQLHLFVVLSKHYVYACKCFDKKPIVKEFRSKMVLQWKTAKFGNGNSYGNVFIYRVYHIVSFMAVYNSSVG